LSLFNIRCNRSTGAQQLTRQCSVYPWLFIQISTQTHYLHCKCNATLLYLTSFVVHF
jgi:hypothetical protein